jgi:hypothetical protein
MIRVTIRTRDSDLVTDLFGGNAARGSLVTIAEHAEAELVSYQKKTALLPLSEQIIDIVIKVGTGVATGVATALLADWLRSLLKRSSSLEIDKKRIEVCTHDDLVRTIEEKIRSGK